MKKNTFFMEIKIVEQRINIVIKMLLEGKSKTLEKIVSSINQNFVYCKIFRFHGAICWH